MYFMNGYDWVKKNQESKKENPKAKYSGPPNGSWRERQVPLTRVKAIRPMEGMMKTHMTTAG